MTRATPLPQPKQEKTQKKTIGVGATVRGSGGSKSGEERRKEGRKGNLTRLSPSSFAVAAAADWESIDVDCTRTRAPYGGRREGGGGGRRRRRARGGAARQATQINFFDPRRHTPHDSLILLFRGSSPSQPATTTGEREKEEAKEGGRERAEAAAAIRSREGRRS